MNRDSSLCAIVPRVLVGSALAVAVAASTALVAQPATDRVVTTDAATAPAEQPRRSRERRRAAEPKEATTSAIEPAVAVAADASAETALDAAGSELVCKSYKPTGSRMARRICATAAQWEAAGEETSRQASETLRRAREQSSIVMPQPSSATSTSN